MKTPQTLRQRALTVIELLVVIAFVALLAMLVLPWEPSNRAKSGPIYCRNNLKQIGLAYRQFSLDHGERFPWQVSPTNGGSQSNNWFTSGYTYRHLMVLSNELGNSPKILVCRSDRERPKAAQNFSAILDGRTQAESAGDSTIQFNQAISYFVGLDATEENPQSILAGDRNLIADVSVPAPIRFGSTASEPPWIPATNLLTGSSPIRWGFDQALHQGGGNILMGDGSVQQLSNPRLHQVFKEATATDPRGFKYGFLFPNNPGRP